MVAQPPPIPPQMPRPVVSYFSEESQFLMKVVRAVGIVLLVSGALRLTVRPIGMLLQFPQMSGPYGGSANSINFLVSIVSILVMSILSIIGGAGCMFAKPRGRILILVWAWLYVAFIMYGTGYSFYFYKVMVRSRAFPTISYMLNSLDQAIAPLALASVCLILFSRPEVRRLFSENS